MKDSPDKRSVRGLLGLWRALKQRPYRDLTPPSIGDLVQGEMEKLDLADRLGHEEIAAQWNVLAGSFLASQTRPESLRHGTLTVLVANPAVHYTLAGMKHSLLSNIQKSFGANKVRDIRFKVG